MHRTLRQFSRRADAVVTGLFGLVGKRNRMSTVHKEDRFAGESRSPSYADLIIQGLKDANVEIVASLPESLLKQL